MSTQDNVQTVKDFLAAIGRSDLQDMLALLAEDIEWINPGTGWPLAGTWRGHAGVQDLFKTYGEQMESVSMESLEFVAQGDRVLVVGVGKNKMKSTNKSFVDHFIFAMTVRDGKVTNIREYIDTQALAQASEPA